MSEDDEAAARVGLDAAEAVRIGQAHLAAGDNATAEAYFARASALAPDDAVCRHLRVTALQRMERLDEALSLLIPAIRSARATETDFVEAVSAAQRVGRGGLALLLCSAGRRRFADSTTLLERHAGLVHERRPRPEAIAALESDRGRFIEGRLSTPLYLLSALYAQDGRYQASLDAVREARRWRPDDRAMLKHEIAVMGRMGLYAEAAPLCDDLLAGQADDEAALDTAFAR
jgi:tetratricopeptide (TPR) repeat protein